MNISELISAVRSIATSGARVIVPVILVLMLIYPWADATFFAPDRIMDRINLLREFNELSKTEFESSEAQSLYESIRNDISSLTADPTPQTTLSSLSGIDWGKFIAGAILWMIAAVVALFAKNMKLWQRIFSGFFMAGIAIVAGLISSAIPTIWFPWVNWILINILQVAFIYSFARQPKK